MAKLNKLQNIKAVQQMIDGTHKFQTKKSVGFSDAEATKKEMTITISAISGKMLMLMVILL